MSHENRDKTTHFGFSKVPVEEKSHLVAKVFQSVAPKYNLMNDCMSLGLHRLWKHLMIAEANLKKGQCVLDVASGTGDLVIPIAQAIGKTGKVYMTDINAAMLAWGQDRLADAGIMDNVECVQADAEHLPFTDNFFDCITIAFGLRNVTNKEAALRSMYRVLKPGGKLLILEFSQPKNKIVNKLYDLYSFHVIPALGQCIAGDRKSYEYLVESIRMHPSQETLKDMLIAAEFEDVVYHNFHQGIVALHIGYKY